MPYFDTIDVSVDIDANKKSKECIIYRCWYYLYKGFKFQLDVCNCCHDRLMMSMNLNDFAMISKFMMLIIVVL